MKELVKDLRKQVTLLEDDLRVRSEEVEEFSEALRSEYAEAREAKRTAATYETWRDDRVTQAAVAWVLGTVFVRYCEDNDLIEFPFIAGSGEKLVEAEDRHEQFFRDNPHLNDRDWLIESFDYLASTHPAIADLFDKRHNPIWKITPSFEISTTLLKFWRRRSNNGESRYCFTGPDTRLLGDLYEHLSKFARKTFALLQTPIFVEEFILDLTLDPSINEFGLQGLRVIDPACGSGHFLLGAFHRILKGWREAAPGVDDWELIRRTLGSVHGCDKNSFAVSIARFRLAIAANHASGGCRLNESKEFPIRIAVGDSLIHGEQASSPDLKDVHTYDTEDVGTFIDSCDLLKDGSYHAVIGNPPYITANDKQESLNYRDRFTACTGMYALSIPFAQRLFRLAIRTNEGTNGAGFVGQITSNSFMKREFGKKLVESFFPTINLTHIIDTSGAHIPGHGTPTVILIGRNCPEQNKTQIRAALGVRGEPTKPPEPSKGKVWSAIVKQLNRPGSESEWITVADFDRPTFTTHPWSLSGGGATELLEHLKSNSQTKLGSKSFRIGFAGMTHADDAMIFASRSWKRRTGESKLVHPIGAGDGVRDWVSIKPDCAFFPYDENLNLIELTENPLMKVLWPLRTELGNRATMSGKTYFAENRPWHEWHQLPKDLGAHPKGIAFSFVATHNHFSAYKKGDIFKQSAPVIKLPQSSSQDELLSLLGLLNSSISCFWLKQVSHNKGNGVDSSGARTTASPWEDFYEFTGTKLQQFPLPEILPLAAGKALTELQQELVNLFDLLEEPTGPPNRDFLRDAHGKYMSIRSRMIALQEELDWQAYALYNFFGKSEERALVASSLDSIPEVKLGERAFEIVLARAKIPGSSEISWFIRHNSKATTEIPTRWPNWYQEIIQARIDAIANRRDISFVEQPTYKRRWATQPWEKRESETLRNWLLDRCESDSLWFSLRDGMKQPRTLTVSQLADQFKNDEDMNSVAQLYATDHLKKRDLTLAQILEQVVADQHLPYLAALRYKDTGLRKRDQWEQVWELQRDEDRTGERLDIPVPPKYASTDFRKPSYWSQRGKLDVPKERFVSYPGASPDSDPTLLLGWAGWDHKDQAQAIVNAINDRGEQAGWGVEKVTPLLAGLLELMPWVKQWHGEYDDDWGGNPAEEYQAYFDDQCAKHQLTEKELRTWRPAAATRRRAARTKGDLL